jgi:poly-gamma-glutamate capsule biosynthesis protein CapA/YwtB (metallophosphatase superfamily)
LNSAHCDLTEMKTLKGRTRKLLTRYLGWAAYSRFRLVQAFVWRLIGPEGCAFSSPDSAVRILVGGDVTFDLEIRSPRYQGVYCLAGETSEHWALTKTRRRFWGALCKSFYSPKFFSAKSKVAPFQELLIKTPENEKRAGLDRYHRTVTRFNVDYPSAAAKFAYPFEKIAPFLKARDLVLVNLETPLTGHPRARGLFLSDPRYAQAMREAGISIVSLANNHIFDGGEIGFLETLDHLRDAGIAYAGAGRDLQHARSGTILQLNRTKFVFLSYTQFCNAGYSSIAADYPGILPMDRALMVEDIKVARERADLVFVCLHWGFENQPNVHPKQVEIAHLLVDAGADGIIGHHPHIPHGIEVYKQRPILYSLGNFIFGRARREWSDNFLAEIIVDQKRVQGIVIYPLSGQGPELFQPEVLGGTRADALLHELQIKSAIFDTGIAIQDRIGYVRIQQNEN